VLEGEAADARDDVYALACIAYVLLTGKHPFKENTALKARTARLVPRRPRGLSQRQWNVLRAGLNHDRERRPSDMRAWIERLDLRTATNLPPLLSFWTVRPRRSGGGKWTVAAALAAVLGAGGWWAFTHRDSVTRAGEAVRTPAEALYERAFDSQQWRKGLSIGGHAEPVIQPPNAPADAAGRPARPAAAGGDGVQANSTGARRSDPSGPAPAATLAPPATVPAAAPDRVLARPVAVQAATPPPTPATASSATPEAARNTPAEQSGPATRARIELAADNVEVPPGEPMAHIVVRRSRGLHGDISFNWWTESGTAKPLRDFVPVNTQVEHIENGQSAISLIIPVVVDPARRESRSFYVVIDQPSDNATLGRTLTMVTLPGSAADADGTSDR
jgi:hypothetical protein